MNTQISKIAVLTSGGDAPGMNAAIRSLVRSAEFNNIQCVGVQKGFQGLIDSSFELLSMRSVSNILGIGGTFLHSARSIDFMQKLTWVTLPGNPLQRFYDLNV